MTAALSLAFEAQAAFRALMDALARPGEIRRIPGVSAPSPLLPATAAILRSLADYETPVWLDARFAEESAAADWIRFHTGAPLAREAEQAVFAVVADAQDMPSFTAFAQGSAEYPDRSTTIIVQMDSFAGETFTLAGPGIKTERIVTVGALPHDFPERWAANRALFPRGIDLVLVAGEQVVAFPRTVNVTRKA
jgi:alpha-D-ribose 1-methylphosphonate 5-triphosphate synthase subunit PhnH